MYSLGGLTAEDEKTNGLGNLVMDMLPRGTKTRSAQQIAEFFDSIGGDLSTECGNNSWFWNMTCLKEDLPRAFEVYGDVVNNAAFPESELPAMKQRILAEIDSLNADWHSQATRFFRQRYFGPTGSPYQFMVVGRKEVVEPATPQQMRQWYETRVLSGNRVMAIFGDVELGTARQLAQANILRHQQVTATPAANAATPASATVNPATGEPPTVNVARVEVQKTDKPLAGVVIGFKSSSIISQPSFPVTVIDTMTSGYGYPTGYLHEMLRGRGLVYVVHAYDMPGRSAELPGTFLVYAGCDPARVNEVVDLIIENIARCQGSAQDMKPDWFERSKQLIVTGEALQNETAAQQAQRAALDELNGLGYDFHDRFAERIGLVTIDQVQQTARARLAECVITVSTPQPDLVKQQTGVRKYPTFPPVELTPQGVQHEMAR
jgi:zinc protease